MKTSNKLSINSQYEKFIERFFKWAKTRQDIRAAIVIGSRARLDHPADEWADLDIIVISTNPEYYTSEAEWVDNIGNPLLTFVEPTPTGDTLERRVLFEGMLDVDFSIVPKRGFQQLLQPGINPQTTVQISNIFGRGMRVLVDKDGMLAQVRKLLESIQNPTPSPPTQDEFVQVVNDFIYHSVWTAKHIRRGELWWALGCVNCKLSFLLLRMIEWHARVTHGWNYDTWLRGRFLEEWADRRVQKGLRKAYAHYDREDIAEALLGAMDLFRWVSIQTADKLGFSYPTSADRQVADWIESWLLKENRTH